MYLPIVNDGLTNINIEHPEECASDILDCIEETTDIIKSQSPI